ncbi:hypothetical protein ACL02U_09765 [Streptomyces sp. MS06]|uniref:hypothetical protein n=1 Tax=Streptomyces sp. MS06 TaxID=3385974 RepID=UPI0039A20717
MFVRRRKYSDLYIRYQLALKATAKARKESSAFRNAAATSARQVAEADPVEVARLREQVGVLIAERNAERKRADGLQARLDDALGLNTSAMAEGAKWQSRREDKRWSR